jgi:DNA polymerase III subunit epsilon
VTRSEGNQSDFEAMAAALEATGEYRVLRKIHPRRQIIPKDDTPTLTALFVDVETTGLDPTCNEIIELAMVLFTYARDGRIFSIGDPFNGLREPSEPIPPDITRITGITQAMVADKRIDSAEVSRFIHTADLIIAHNAAFDRRILERFCPGFENKPWGCSNGSNRLEAGGL